jgi:membrane protein YdbS with pleckstrin-like domain
MLEIARRLWQITFSSFIALVVGIIPLLIFVKGTPLVIMLVIMTVLAIACLTIAIYAFVYDFRYCRKKAKEEKIEANKKALAESFRKAHPEWTDKQVEIAVKG